MRDGHRHPVLLRLWPRYNTKVIKTRKLYIFTAVEFEAQAIARAIENAGISAQVQVVGIGAKRLPQTLPGDAGACIMAGLAGALDPKLRVGDVVLDERSIELGDVPLARGRIATVDRIVSTPAEKAALGNETGAVAVEMESRFVHELAQRCGVPYVGLRAISDSADESLDADVLGMIDEDGRTRPLAVVRSLLRRPGLAGHLFCTGINARVAARALGQAVMLVVDRLNKRQVEGSKR